MAAIVGSLACPVLCLFNYMYMLFRDPDTPCRALIEFSLDDDDDEYLDEAECTKFNNMKKSPYWRFFRKQRIGTPKKFTFLHGAVYVLSQRFPGVYS